MKNARKKLETPMAPAMPCKGKSTECLWKETKSVVSVVSIGCCLFVFFFQFLLLSVFLLLVVFLLCFFQK